MDAAEGKPLMPADTGSAASPQNRKQSVDGLDSDADDKLIDESNIESLVRDLPQATDRTVQFLDNLLAVLPNKYAIIFPAHFAALQTTCTFPYHFCADGETLLFVPFSRC